MLNSCRARRLSATVSSGMNASCPICDRQGAASAIVARGRSGKGEAEHCLPYLRSSRLGGQANQTPARLICDRLGWAVMARRSRAPERADSNARERGAQGSTQPWPFRRDSRTPERRSSRTGVRFAYHPQGVRLDGHLLRGGAATRTVDHCTSPPFVPSYRTRWSRGAQAAFDHPEGVGTAPHWSSSTALSRVGSWPAATSVGRVTTTSMAIPVLWLQVLV